MCFSSPPRLSSLFPPRHQPPRPIPIGRLRSLLRPRRKAFVGRFDRMELLKDEVFVKALEDLAQGELSPEAKADAFALMQERIGWLFVGAVRLFPKHGYAQTMASILSTYFKYQEKMPADLKVGPLLVLARTARGDHPLRASNALLLATILNHKAAKDAVKRAIDCAGDRSGTRCRRSTCTTSAWPPP